MSAFFPNGTIFSLFTTQAAPKTITDITNANPGVVASVAHGYIDTAILLLSGAGRLDNRIVRVAGKTTDAYNLEGINTLDLQQFPDNFGVGAKSFLNTVPVPLNQITNSETSGGEQQFFQWVYLEDGRQRQRPTFKNARALKLTLDWDPTLAWHAALLAADSKGIVHALEAALPNGDKLYYSVYVGFDGEPTFNINQNMQTTADFALASPYSTRYAAP